MIGRIKKIKTAKKAKRLSIEVWKYIAETGIWHKSKLPMKLYEKVRNLRSMCPLCEYFTDTVSMLHCERCPLYKAGHQCNRSMREGICTHCDEEEIDICEECYEKRDYYTRWRFSYKYFTGDELIEKEKAAAKSILNIIENWKV